MKKLFAILMAMLMVVTLVGCSKEPTPTVTTKTYTLGMGVVVSTDSTTETTGQVDATFAAVVLDADGKIVACHIDCAQNKMSLTEVDPEATFLTKVEKQYDYNMVKYSEATLEWFEQVANFEAYVTGMTASEVAAIETKLRDDGLHEGYVVAADADLFAQCSISLPDLKEVVVKACNDEQAKTFETAGEFTLGIAAITDASSSTEEEVQMYTDFAAAVVADGKILAAIVDAIQPKISTADATVSFKGTKRELKEGYNMVAWSEATLEWYQQAANFTDYVVGMSAGEVAAIETKLRDDGLHEGYVVAADADLFAQCSIQITTFQENIAKACNNAK